MKRLLTCSERILHEIESLEEDSMKYIKKPGYEMTVFFQFFYAQFTSMDSVLILLKKNKYKECFIILRSILESYLFLLQMMKCKVYKNSIEYTIIPNPGSTKEEARNNTLEKWKNEWKRGDKTEYKDIIAKNDDKIIITYEWTGLYEEKDIKEEGYWISRYFFAFEEYSHEIRFLSDLPTIAAGDWMPDVTKSIKKEHKKIYHHVFYIDSIIKNLKNNHLINDEQKDRIIVHYNFLSSFTHPTKNVISYFGDPRVVYTKGVEEKITIGENGITKNYIYSKYEKKIIEEQIILYVCKLQMLFISLILDFFESLSSNSDWSKKYSILTRQLEEATRDFWFIFDNPTEFDICDSEMRKTWLNEKQKTIIPKDLVLYYTNPLERLTNLKNWQIR